MATTELHVLVMYEHGTDATDTLVFTGWTPEAARQAFIDEQRQLAEDDPEGVWPFATWEEWEADEDEQLAWAWREETHHLPA